jgi:hypothetical protein
MEDLTDPTFDPPCKTYEFGWGSRSTKLTGQRSNPTTSDRSTLCQRNGEVWVR